MFSRRIRHLIIGVMLLRIVASVEAAETRLPFDSRSLVEVDKLDVVPKEILQLLGWHREGSDGVAERFDQFNATGSSGSKLPNRLFETAGVSSAAAVLIYRQAGRPPTYHSVAFMMTPAGWSRVGE